MRRKSDPEKYCEFTRCAKRLYRRAAAGKQIEEHGQFLRRRFCDRICAMKARHRLTLDTSKLTVRLRPDEISSLRAIAGRRHHGDLARAIGSLAKSAAPWQEREEAGEDRGLTHEEAAWIRSITQRCEAGVESFDNDDVSRLLVVLEKARDRARVRS